MESHRASIGELTSVLGATQNIRNICILAHVDHGKTTLSDSLVCSNGFISNKLAGKLRFLDSTEEEQKRGITMHSSAISLLYRAQEGGKKPPAPPSAAAGAAGNTSGGGTDYLVNLVDSPGHIDFSSDVSTAARLCDGALIVVDVLEGVCTQTHAVLYKALKEGMTPCLVLNKIDRLALELQLTPLEALRHLRRIIENVNALASTLLNSESLVSETMKYDQEKDRGSSAAQPTADTTDEAADPLAEQWQFAAEKGNVIFSSALDCWGFGTLKFANIWAKKFGVNKGVLYKYMFEDYYFSTTSKKICKCDPSDASHVPMAVPLIFEPIWRLYNICVTEKDTEKAAKMAERGLGVTLTAREANARDPRGTVQTIFQKWIPLSEAVLRMVVRCVPGPEVAQATKEATLFGDASAHGMHASDHSPVAAGAEGASKARTAVLARASESMQHCIDGVKRCSVDIPPANSSPVVVFISKMMPVRLADLTPEDAAMIRQQRRQRALDAGSIGVAEGVGKGPSDADESDVLMALGRVFSGTLTKDSSYHVLNHRHRPHSTIPPAAGLSVEDWAAAADLQGKELEQFLSEKSSIPSTVSSVASGTIGLYLCFGPSLKSVPFMPAGNIVGIIGLEQQVLKTGTLSSSFFCPPMRSISFQAKPILRVAVEPTRHQDLAALEVGLKALYQYDPVVEVSVEANGEFTISCLGELHLELCLKALSNNFAKCEVKVSPPLVPYRETVFLSTASEFLPALDTTDCSVELPLEGELIDPVNYLPAPWVDTPGLDKVQRGRATAVTGSDSLCIEFSCGSIPAKALTLLMELNEQDVAENDNSILEYNTSTSGSEAAQLAASSAHQGLRCLTYVLDMALTDHDFMDCDLKSSFSDQNSDIKEAARVVWRNLARCLSPTGATDGPQTNLLFQQLVSLGPDTKGPNLLLLSKRMKLSVWKDVESMPASVNAAENDEEESSTPSRPPQGDSRDGLVVELDPFSENKEMRAMFDNIWTRMLRPAVVTGFQVTCARGPMMEEPLQGVSFFVMSVDLACTELPRDLLEQLQQFLTKQSEPSVPPFNCAHTVSTSNIMAGHLIPEVKNTLRMVMMGSNLRVVEPIFSCSVQCDQSQLGNLYAVLAKRRGEVTHEDIIEGTSLFLLSATLPVSNSFGFAQELLKKTSGKAVTPQLLFSNWNMIQLDPFWKPTTEVELEDHGGQAVVPNVGRNFINDVRKRKGLPLEEKIVVAAEKQRNLTRNK